MNHFYQQPESHIETTFILSNRQAVPEEYCQVIFAKIRITVLFVFFQQQSKCCNFGRVGIVMALLKGNFLCMIHFSVKV